MAVVGSGVVAQLGISTVETQPAVFIGDEAFTVIGVIGDAEGKADLLLSVVVPRSTAQHIWGTPKVGAKVLVSTRLGAATQVAQESAMALDPAHSRYFKAIPPPDPRSLRGKVTGDLDQLLLGTLTVVGVAIAREWTPVIHSMTVTTASAIGLATGLPAGLYPAWRASRITPVEALRRLA